MCIINIYHLYYPQDQGEIKLNWDEGMHWTENHFQKTPWTHHDGMVQLLGMGKTCCNGKKTFIWHCTFVNKGNFLLHTPTQSRGFSRKDSEQDKVNFSSFLWSCRVTPSLAILLSENTKIPGQGSLECANIEMFWSIMQLDMGRAGKLTKVPLKVLILKYWVWRKTATRIAVKQEKKGKLYIGRQCRPFGMCPILSILKNIKDKKVECELVVMRMKKGERELQGAEEINLWHKISKGEVLIS